MSASVSSSFTLSVDGGVTLLEVQETARHGDLETIHQMLQNLPVEWLIAC